MEDWLEEVLRDYQPPPKPIDALPAQGPYDCQSCGACCVEAGHVEVREGEGVPEEFIERRDGWETIRVSKYMGGRCKALTGVIGACVGCGIYERRPRVCRAFEPGSEGCRDARQRSSYKMRQPNRPRGYGIDWLETV